MSTWLITGCSTGLGKSLAQAVLDAGSNAVVTARDVHTVEALASGHPDTAAAIALDATNKAQIESAVKLAEDRFGSVDVLVNNAGYGYRAAVEEGDDKDVADLFATNFFGTVSMIKAVLPGMHARRRGTILNVSSIAGRLAAPGSGYYSASKFAIEGLSDALRKEVAPWGSA
jgi:NADP-dependent 3-hydroxy acid dehydrogenase YdfG